MSPQIPERLVWAVEVLAVQPTEQILEIGCGHGVAAALIGAQLTTGKLTAIDRSPTMIKTASQRNKAHIDAGKVVFQTAALADFRSERFDKIFAVNVNVFWLKPAQELSAIKSLLAPGGGFYLFYQPPDPALIPNIVEKLTRNLQTHGFAVKQTLVKDVPAMLCVMA